MAYLVDGSDNILVTSADNALVTDLPGSSVPMRYVAFNMCLALLAVLPLLE
jgi:hypothetical protein